MSGLNFYSKKSLKYILPSVKCVSCVYICACFKGHRYGTEKIAPEIQPDTVARTNYFVWLLIENAATCSICKLKSSYICVLSKKNGNFKISGFLYFL